MLPKDTAVILRGQDPVHASGPSKLAIICYITSALVAMKGPKFIRSSITRAADLRVAANAILNSGFWIHGTLPIVRMPRPADAASQSPSQLAPWYLPEARDRTRATVFPAPKGPNREPKEFYRTATARERAGS